MNEKASVSKELNAKHTKILEGLVKLPENRECADCRSKAPRWASINLGIFMHAMFWNTPESRSTHLKGTVYNIGHMASRASCFMQMMGNKKSNDYWEAELSPGFDRNPIQKFINAKYVQKKWASKTSMQPALEVSQEISVGPSGRGIPKKARKYSLDEDIFSKGLAQMPPTTRNRGLLQMGFTAENDMSSKNVDATTDLFSLLYVSDAQQERTVVPPSRWATFESHGEKVATLDIIERLKLQMLRS
ncbi:putative ADP-ribosylation factor GTPase-activating protein AGD15 [Sesamum angolense]|uniref:ADP-ribosylation factor GTPase-activating protein AGD15 n=1 Tax=Sesamum angolense TaxID=2727404 RepID=A0AAE2BRI3_9LAMI|nr:putative ADP-ribosylation factor GTPase-activating protein AGD15 [Sesamum angolense]